MPSIAVLGVQVDDKVLIATSKLALRLSITITRGRCESPRQQLLLLLLYTLLFHPFVLDSLESGEDAFLLASTKYNFMVTASQS